MKQINYEEEHRKLWRWLADHPEAGKIDYFKNWEVANWPYNLCFACEAAILNGPAPNDEICDCQYCPLGGRRIVGCKDGLYLAWEDAASREKRRQRALQIANLPWKEADHDTDQL